MPNTFAVPKCPSCHHAMTTDQMILHEADLYAIAPEEGRADVECPNCGVCYVTQGGYTPFYQSAIDPDDLD